jgi:hypothetical protein
MRYAVRFVDGSLLSLGVLLLACGASPDGARSSNPPASGGGAAMAGGSAATSGGSSTGGGVPSGGSAGSSNPSSGGSTDGGSTSGGSAGSPNSGGSDGELPHVVKPCPNGDATMDVWENITPADITAYAKQYKTQAVLINPQDTSMVYVGSDSAGVFKSTDCGATWFKVNTGENAAEVDKGAEWSMAMDYVDPDVIFAVNGYGSTGLWRTKNGGVDWEQLFPPESEVAQVVDYNFVSIVAMDPTNHLHLVISMHAPCKGAYAPNCQAETLDGGDTWRLFKGPGGGEGGGPIVFNETTWVYGAPLDGKLYLTTDSGATWSVPINAGAHYQTYRATDGTYYIGTGGGVIRSSDNGITWNAIPNSNGQLTGIAGSGQHIYVSQQFNGGYFVASEDDPTIWTEFDGPPNETWGSYWMAYDPDHKILYSSNQTGGLWRMLTE